MKPVPSTVTKTYPKRGPLRQFRFVAATAFVCFRCGASKKSKLVTTYDGDWSKKLCNGCYGWLLSIYQIRAGTGADEEKVEQLANLLLSLVNVDVVREAEYRLLVSETRAEHLSSKTLRFVATAEYVAEQLGPKADIEWSPAIIGLCKAVESEIVDRLILPLANRAASRDLSVDKKDKDIGRIAAFCADRGRTPPELGSIAHFLQTVANSRRRRDTSNTIRAFLELATDWSGSQWLLNPRGLHDAIGSLTAEFRNKAAHLHELNKSDYRRCHELILGPDGILWKLHISLQ